MMAIRVALVLCLLVYCVALQSPNPLISNLGVQNAWASESTGCATCLFVLTEAAKNLSWNMDSVQQSMIYTLIPYLQRKEQPDWICSKIKLCKQCLIHTQDEATISSYFSMPKHQRIILNLSTESTEIIDRQYKARVLGSILEGQFLKKYFIKVPNTIDAKLAEDKDQDGFSFNNFGRRKNSNWRGKDCNDTNAQMRPFLKQINETEDINCNGVEGMSPILNQTYEDVYCNSGESIGRNLIFFGDSYTAGFSIASDWIYQNDSLHKILPLITNELSFPELAWSSGFSMDSISSVYLILKHINRCVNQQFANYAFNGATVADFASQIEEASFSSTMKPFLVFVGFPLGDICKQSLDQMPSAEEIRIQYMNALSKLEAQLPPNSKVVLLGPMDGSYVYNIMANQNHPLSTATHNITYADFYQFLDCNQVNPCATWFTKDDASRAAASQRSNEYGDVIKQIVLTIRFNNFDLAYIEMQVVLEQIMYVLDRNNQLRSQAFDMMDGMHLNFITGHRLMSSTVFVLVPPDFIEPFNPNNDLIDLLLKPSK